MADDVATLAALLRELVAEQRRAADALERLADRDVRPPTPKRSRQLTDEAIRRRTAGALARAGVQRRS